MNCREMTDFLYGYVEDELPPCRKRCFESHLANCPECVAYLAAYRATIRLARSSPRPTLPAMPEDLVRAILSAADHDGDGASSTVASPSPRS